MNHGFNFNRSFYFLRALKIAVFVVVFIGVVSWLFMKLWNAIIPDIFSSLKPLDYWHALGLLVLARLLFGGRPGFFHHYHGRHHWRHRLRSKWEHMTPEEREKFRSGMQRWCQFSDERRPARASGISQGSQRP